jgi:hypothetical protein
VRADIAAPCQQLLGRARRLGGLVFLRDAVAAALLPPMFAQELSGARIQDSHRLAVPLHFHAAADPAGRCAVVGSFDFDAAIQVHSAFAELVMAEWL